MVKVDDKKIALFADDRNLVARQCSPVMVAQNGNQHFVTQFLLKGLPFDVKESRIAAGRPVLEYIPPIMIVPPRDCHMVGNDVKNLAEMHFVEALAETRMGLSAAQFLIYMMMIDHVVAVQTSRRRLQIRRTV